MTLVAVFIILQVIAAATVVAVLNAKLQRELLEAALEEMQAKLPSETQHELVITSAGPINAAIKRRIEQIASRKAPAAPLRFEEDPALKSGLVIHMGETVLDFSLADRLKRLFA